MTWTKEQLEAINSAGTNIIVSAGAGSGKTAVLTERVITKLLSGTHINELLILTFTNNAAREMKTRIKKQILKNPELKSELELIESASITTFDAFVLTIIKKYHYLLNLDKNISIIDSSIMLLKKKEFIDSIFLSYYQKNNQNFVNFITSFCSKTDKDMKRIILDIYNDLDLLVDKDMFLNNLTTNFWNKNNLEQLFQQYLNLILKKISIIQDCLEKLKCEVDGIYFEKISILLENFLNAKNYNEIKSLANLKLPSLPRGSSEAAKTIKEQIKKGLDSISSYTEKTQQELILEITETETFGKILINILTDLDKEILKYKLSKNYFEFNDISRFAINLLRDNNKIREELKNSFKEIMIDEYQDTNDTQEEFISLIENNNVYMVGDIKQSIYRFRNANPNIFKNKYDLYKQNRGGIKIDLNKNFRSRSEIVDSINLIFNLVMDDNIGNANYQYEHQMVFGNNAYSELGDNNYNNSLEILDYSIDENASQDEQEAFIIAHDIIKKIKNNYRVFKNDNLIPCTYDDFCILMDRTSSFDTYRKVFEYMKIPLNVYMDENILYNDETVLIKNILTIILKIKNKIFDTDLKFCFTSIARSYLCAYTDEDIFLKINQNKIFEDNIYKKCKAIGDNINFMSNRSILEKILEEFDFYNKMISAGNIQEREVVINNLLLKAEELNNIAVDIYGLEAFFSVLIREKNEIKVSARLTENNSVTITNIHKSKGLEYHVCYYSGLYKKFNLRDSFEKIIFSKEYGLILPVVSSSVKNTFLTELYKNKYLEEEISEKIRLFYVSVTRCKEKMIMVTSRPDKNINFELKNIVDDIERTSYRSFLDIIFSCYPKIEHLITKIESPAIPDDYKFSTKKSLYKPDNGTKILVNENSTIKKEALTSKSFSKSASQLFTKEEKINMELGTKMHYILETLDFSNPNLEQFNYYEKDIIENFLKLPLINNIKGAEIFKEFQFHDISSNSTGVIDLMLVYDDHIDIIDYKLKKTADTAYIKQLQGYKRYIQDKTQKATNTYLYSLIDKELVEI